MKIIFILFIIGYNLFLYLFLRNKLKARAEAPNQTSSLLAEPGQGKWGSEAYLVNILDTAAEGIICLNETGQIILFNKMAERIFGYSASNVLGQSLELLLPQRYQAGHRHYMAAFAQSPVAVRPMGEGRQALWGRRQNGEEFPIEVSISKFELGGQKIFTAALHDISERKQLEEQLYNEVQQRLAEQIMLREVGQRLSSSLEPETVLHYVAEQICQAVNATSVFISRYDPETETATIIAEYISAQARPEEQESVLGVTYGLAQVFPDDIEMLQAGQPKIRHVDDPELSAQQREHLAGYGCQTVLDVPMQIGGRSIAYISVWESRRRRDFTVEEIRLCQAIAQQAAISLQNAHLYAQAQQYVERLEVLHKIEQAILIAQRPATIAEAVLNHIRQLISYDRASIVEFDYEANEGIFLAAQIKDETALGTGLRLPLRSFWCPKKVQYGEVDLIEDLQAIAQPTETIQTLLAEGLRSAMVAPLLFQDDLIGLFNFGASSPHAFSPDQARIAMEVARPLAIAIQQARLHEQIQRYTEALEQRVAERTAELARETATLTTLYHVSQEIVASLELEQVYVTAHQAARQLMSVDAFVIALLDEARQEVEDVYLFDHDQRWPNLRYPLGRGLTSAVITTGRSLRLDNSCDESSNQAVGAELFGTEKDTCSVLAVPLRRGDKIIGVISAQAYLPYAYTDSDLQLLETLANQVSISIANALLYEQAQQEITERRRVEVDLHRHNDYLAALHQIALDLLNRREVEEVLQTIVERAAELLDAPYGEISLAEGDELVVRAFTQNQPFLADDRLQRGQGLVSWQVYDSGKPVIFENYTEATDHRTIYDQLQLRATADLPILVGQKCLGVLALGRTRPNYPFDAEQTQVGLWFAQLAALALDNAQGYAAARRELAERKQAEAERARLFEKQQRTERALRRVNEQLRQRVEELAALNRISQTVATITDLSKALDFVAEEITHFFKAFSTGISLFNEARTERTIVAMYQVQGREKLDLVGRVIPIINDGTHSDYLSQGKSLIVPDPQTSPHTQASRQSVLDRNLQCLMLISLRTRGDIIGTIAISTNQTGRVFTEDELRLAETISTQIAGAIENARLFEQERRQRQIAESLVEVAMTLNRSLDRDTVLATIMEQLERVTRYDSGALFLQEGDELILAKRGKLAERHPRYRLPLASDNPLVRVFKEKQPLALANIGSDPPWQIIGAEPVQSWMGAPLLIGEKVIGVLTADSLETSAYTQEDVQLLQAFASQAAVAIENTDLYRQAQQTAADEERNRLARNLHDSVTQALFSASLVAEVLPQVWQRDPEKAQQGLEKLRRLTRGALAEMRALLIELRPKALLQARLDDLLGQLSQAVTGQAPLDIQIETDPTPALPPEVQLTFYRIAQETFNNIVKHADASQIVVKLRLSPSFSLDQVEAWHGGITLSIGDNGQGFNPDRIAPDKLGLTIMQERAQGIGATLTIESQPGGGTEVALIWQGSGIAHK